jgi:hypothetical protein
MKRPVLRAALVTLLLSTMSCKDKQEQAQVAALEGLRAAIDGNRDTSMFGDSRIMAESAIFHRAAGIEGTGGLSLSQSALDLFLTDIAGPTEPQTYWRRARVYLKPGSCTKLSDAELPSDARVSRAGTGWQQSVRDKHLTVVRRVTNATSADFRCGDGPRFTATFTRPASGEGVRVALITASPRGQ